MMTSNGVKPRVPQLVRRCQSADFEAMHAIINDAAQAYRGVIPPDCWHEPYMRREELHLLQMTAGPVLVGTWAAAEWAIRFYEKHGFRRVTSAEKDRLLRKYWAIPERQVETSVVLERCDRVHEG